MEVLESYEWVTHYRVPRQRVVQLGAIAYNGNEQVLIEANKY